MTAATRKPDARLDRWEEQLSSHAVNANVCGCEEPCPPCARCYHAFCRHEDDGWLPRQCLSAGCDCRMWVSDTDCLDCDGFGYFVPGSVVPTGQLVENSRPCQRCRGTGMRLADDA